MDPVTAKRPGSYAYSPIDHSPRNPWRASPLRRLPLLGFGALLGALISLGAAVAILKTSDGQPTRQWSVQPSVYINIASTLTNILVHFALTEGIKVAWWRRATQANTNIAHLHHLWSHGDSLWAALTSGRHFTLVALACMLVTIVPINGPLLQRASLIASGKFEQNSKMQVQIVQDLPAGYTGFGSGRRNRVALLSTNFTRIVNQASIQTPIDVEATGCSGQCSSTIRGAGFVVNCSTSTVPFALNPVMTQGFPDPDQQALVNGTRVFGAFVSWGDSLRPDMIRIDVQYKDQLACDGLLQIRNCTLQAATVNYPVVVNGNTSTIHLASDPARNGYEMYRNESIASLDGTSGATTLGGLAKALSNTYDSTANLRFAGAVDFELITTGSTAIRYAIVTQDSWDTCSLSFTDPTDDLLTAAHDLMFRAAVGASNSSTVQSVDALETDDLPVYRSNYRYLGLAIMCTLLGWLATIPIFFGWWHMGRDVSMSPIETAKAFAAPSLESDDSNAHVDILMKQVGQRPIRYGATVIPGTRPRLEMNDPQFIRLPYQEERFQGRYEKEASQPLGS